MMSDDLIDTRLGQYHITEVIRRGGMSTVYKAYQASLDRDVAVKVMRHDRDPQFVARFKREARAIAQLQHHNILPIYDYGEQDGLLYLVLQYIEHGVTLGDLLGAPIEPSAALRLASHVLDALEYAHSRGIIHRDIKPSNVLMPSPSWPMLADFGIAKLINDNQQRLTVPGLIIGTAAYMAPEQATGQPIDARTDLYATGVVLYEMLTGRVPFDADTPMAVLTKHVYEPPPPPRVINPDLPAPVEAVLLRALAKDPSARYQTAATMAADLARLANQIEHGRARSQVTGFYQAGVQAFEEGHWDEAVERLSQLVAIDPSYEDATELLEAAREAQEQARIAARQQLELVRQRRQSTIHPQVGVPPMPTAAPSSPPQSAPPATHETKRLDPIVPSAAAASSSAGTPTQVAGSATAPPAWRRYALWAIAGVVVVVLALFLIRNIGGPPLAQVPTAVPASGVPPSRPTAPAPTAAPTSPPPTAMRMGDATAVTTPPGMAMGDATAMPGGGHMTEGGLAGPLRPDPPGQPAYAEDFNNQKTIDFENPADQTDEFQYTFHAPGAYALRLKKQHDTRWVLEPRVAYSDFVMRIDAWDNSDDVTAGDAAQGIVFRALDETHFYALLVDPRKGRYAVRKLNGSTWSDKIPWTPSPLVHRSADTNQLRVDAAGDTFTIYLNGELLGNFSDQAYRFGMLGIIIQNEDALEPHMHFDNLKAWRNDPPAAVFEAKRKNMVAIPAGPFIMGSDKRTDSRPIHIVTLLGFLIDRTEVTNAAYKQCVDTGKCDRPAELGSDRHPSYFTDSEYAEYPVIHVTWKQAQDYCAWAGKRLPTEAEWEKAASWNAATEEKFIWPWDDVFDPERLNTNAKFGDTTQVGKFPPELNGTFDMAGNVWEWTGSLDKPYPYNKDDGREKPDVKGNRILRGGSWTQDTGARAAYRLPADPNQEGREVGFRCAATP